MQFDPKAPLRGAIAAMTRDHVIGLDGAVPWHYSEDLKRFKQRTLNTTIIMGRLTWESINQKPLPGRRNIVISRNLKLDVECYCDLTAAFDICRDEDIWIIGGGELYNSALPYLTLLDITYVPNRIESNEAIRFPKIDSEHWCAAETEIVMGTPLVNVIYHRRRFALQPA